MLLIVSMRCADMLNYSLNRHMECEQQIIVCILAECGPLWIEHEGVGALVFHSTTFSRLHTSHIAIVSIPGFIYSL